MLERNLLLGVDPGQSGGFAILDPAGAVVDVTKCPETEKDISDYFAEFAPRLQMAVIESVHSFPGQGVSSSFKFGMNYGALRMGLIAHGIPFEYVSPGKWQHPFGLLEKGRKATDSNTEKKNKHKSRAQELFPAVKICHWNTDALLLAEYLRRTVRAICK